MHTDSNRCTQTAIDAHRHRDAPRASWPLVGLVQLTVGTTPKPSLDCARSRALTREGLQSCTVTRHPDKACDPVTPTLELLLILRTELSVLALVVLCVLAPIVLIRSGSGSAHSQWL